MSSILRCGIDPRTGAVVYGVDAMRCSIADILSTPIGSCVARRDYGSYLYKLVDAAMNGAFMSNMYQAAVVPILKWERDCKPLSLNFDLKNWKKGVAELDLECVYVPDGRPITIDGILIDVSR